MRISKLRIRNRWLDRVRCGTGMLAAVLLSASILTAAGVKIYTTSADFDEGILINLNHNPPFENQLQVNEGSATQTYPFVNVAVSGRGTIVRIDVNTGVILGEYFTAPAGRGRDPSRTTVDQLGSVWVSNRAESSTSGGQPKGSITRVGLIIGGTRSDASGNPLSDGEYLKPPFAYSTCVDRDGDGLIRTSRGLGHVLAWTNAGSADTHGGVSTAADECIINYTRVTGTGTRTVAIDANNDVWAGGLGDLDHEKVSGVTGQPVPGTQFNLGCGGYGGLVDSKGVLWSSRGGSGLLRFDTATFSGLCLGNANGDYGLAVDPVEGYIWHTAVSGNRVCKLLPTGVLVQCYPHGNQSAQGVAVDGKGNVWVAHSIVSSFTTVGHLRTDGTYVGNVSLPGGSGPTGVAVDANGKVWVTNYYSNNAMRIDPDAGPVGGGGFRVGAVDLTVALGSGATPYNYSDMTGFVALANPPQGIWSVTRDGGVSNKPWGIITWNTEPEGAVPPGTSLTVGVRTANSQSDLASLPFTTVINGANTGAVGRYLEVQVRMGRSNGSSAVLSDLSIHNRRCHIDDDNDVDLDDINLIMAARNTAAIAGDARDADKDGMITVLDARACTLVCTRPNCAR